LKSKKGTKLLSLSSSLLLLLLLLLALVARGSPSSDVPLYGKVPGGWTPPVKDTLPAVHRVDLGGEQDVFHEIHNPEAYAAMAALGRAEAVRVEAGQAAFAPGNASLPNLPPPPPREADKDREGDRPGFDDEAVDLPAVQRSVAPAFQGESGFPCSLYSDDITTVSVVESHSAALRPLLASAACGAIARKAVELVHLDTHSDLLSPRRAIPRVSWPVTPAVVEALVSASDAGSYILPLWAVGLVGSTTWVRSLFKDGYYNEPSGFGEVEVKVGLTADGQHVCAEAEDGTIKEGEGGSSRCRRDVLRDGGDAVKRVTLRTTSLADFTRNWAAGVSAGWVLDLDLDFFASDEPVMRALQRIGMSRVQIDRLRHAVQSVEEVVVAAGGTLTATSPRHPNPNDQDQRDQEKGSGGSVARESAKERRRRGKDLRTLMVNMILHHMGGVGLYRSSVPRLKYPPKPLEAFGSGQGAQRGARALDALADAMDATLLTQTKRRQLKSLVRGDPEGFFDGLLRPEPYAFVAPEAIVRQCAALKAALSAAPHPPALVLVSRSVRDGYLPFHLWPVAEECSLAAIQQALKEKRRSFRIEYERGIRLCPRPPQSQCNSKRPPECFEF
jgi:hypothetical protein